MVKVNIEVDVYNMRDGVLVDFIYDGKLYKEHNGINSCSKSVKPKKVIMNRYPNMVDRWISEKNIKSFKTSDFYKDHNDEFLKSGKRLKERFDAYVSKMIADKSLVQMGNDEFMVNKKIR